MATGIDIVAGTLEIVGVVQQPRHSAYAIKDFCRNVKNAPSELQETIDQVRSPT